jgi:F0F1-type ATP synthase membrane subunit c/vacuolar-type H+-ATPase subunit K
MAQERSNRAPAASGTRTILWVSFLTAVVAYGVVGYAVLGRSPAQSPLPAWLWPLVAGIFAAAAFLVPGRLADRVSEAPATQETPEAPPFLRPQELVSWAFAEAVAIVGLVSVAVGSPRGPLAAYLAVAAVILWLRRPTD